MRALFAVAMLTACGGSGLDSEKLVVELSESEIDELCDYILEKRGGARTETCTDVDGEYTVEFPDFDECVATFIDYSEDCPSTVGQEEECAEKLGEDPCDDPAACRASADC